jgi:hypothetical protein
MVPPERPFPWEATPPDRWPDPPTDMTVTTLLEIEACPRRWALMAASYPTLWSGRGYPPRLTLAGLGGTVVHLALEQITRAFVEAGCRSSAEPAAVQVMRALGGYTSILHNCIQVVQNRILSNPRASRIGDQITRSLRAQIPELRSRTQALISTVEISDGPAVAAPHERSSSPTSSRVPLTAGAYSELELRVPFLGWKGRADLLVLSEKACHLTDFKTGAAAEAHDFQLQVYALLWSRDSELNPGGRRADRLTVAYSSGQREVAAPTDTRLEELEREVVARRNAAMSALSSIPPAAKPTAENCAYCSARQLCGEYWTWRLHSTADQESDRGFTDLEVIVARRHGPASWYATAEASARFPLGRSVLLRTSDDMQLRPGQRLRVLNAGLGAESTDEEPVVVTLGSFSELYSVAPV